jgi:hypothetical protein
VLRSATPALDLWERIMRTLLMPALGLAFALALAAPTASFAATTTSGGTSTHMAKGHTAKTHKACHPTKTHHCKTMKSAKSTKKSY